MSPWTALDVTCHQDGRLQTLLLSWCLIFVIARFSTLAFVSPHLQTWYIFHWDITEKENYWDNEPEELIISYNKTPFFLLLFGEYVWAVGNEATKNAMKGFLITHILDWRWEFKPSVNIIETTVQPIVFLTSEAVIKHLQSLCLWTLIIGNKYNTIRQIQNSSLVLLFFTMYVFNTCLSQGY